MRVIQPAVQRWTAVTLNYRFDTWARRWRRAARIQREEALRVSLPVVRSPRHLLFRPWPSCSCTLCRPRVLPLAVTLRLWQLWPCVVPSEQRRLPTPSPNGPLNQDCTVPSSRIQRLAEHSCPCCGPRPVFSIVMLSLASAVASAAASALAMTAAVNMRAHMLHISDSMLA